VVGVATDDLSCTQAMMEHQQVEQAALFYEFSLERHAPTDHLLRSIDRFVELGERRIDVVEFIAICRAMPVDSVAILRKLAKLV
jgi:hypothetical protein